MFSLNFRELWSPVSNWLTDELDQLAAAAQSKWYPQHDDQGGHTDVTAASLAVEGDVTTGGDATVTGTVTTAAVRLPETDETAPSLTGPDTTTGVSFPLAGYLYVTTDGTLMLEMDPTGVGVNGDFLVSGALALSTTVGLFQVPLVVTGHVSPQAHNTYDLGTTSSRWRDAWVQRAAFNGSDARLKHDITPLAQGLAFVRQLRPVSYRWKDDGDQSLFYGFTAQDLLEAGFVGVDTSNPDSYAVRYTDLIAPLAKAVQELDAEVQALRQRVASLES